MKQSRRFTAITEREDNGFVALCSELDIASQGLSVEEARTSLVEALTLFFEVADEAEVSRRLHSEAFVTQVEVPGTATIWVTSDPNFAKTTTTSPGGALYVQVKGMRGEY
jgi:predicted RNase H-like HicB family nuclease